MAEEEEVAAARAQIERSRADLAATADDLHDRLSPRQMAGRNVAKAKNRAGGLLASTRQVVIGVPASQIHQVQQVAGRVGEAAGGFADSAATGIGQGPARVKGSTQGNPIGAGLVAFGLGLLAAAAIPPSSAERQAASSMGRQLAPVKEHLQEVAQEIGGATRDSAQQAAQQVQSTATEATQELMQQGKSAAADVAGEGKSAAQEIRQ